MEVILLLPMSPTSGQPPPGLATVLEAKLDKGAAPLPRAGPQRHPARWRSPPLRHRFRPNPRALDDRGNAIMSRALPVELLGLESMPDVGDTCMSPILARPARSNEIRAREVAMAKTRIT